MPPLSYRVAPEVSPQGAALPQTGINVSAEDTGALTARGFRELGAGALDMSDFFGQVAADEAGNQYSDRVRDVLYGKAGAMVQNEAGEMVPDTGFLGLKGAAALRARPEVEKQIDAIARETGGALLTPKSKLQFDNTIRRYKAITDGQIGNHARVEGQVYATRVNKASEKLAIEEISADPDNMPNVLAATERLISAKVKQAQLDGGGPELINEARVSARRDAMTARLLAVGATDPSRALRLLERDKAIAGTHYDNLYNSFRARADQQDGRAVADGILGGKLEAGHDTKAVLRHFEGFKPQAYEDKSPGAPTAWRVGYGSDTVTRADGRVERVTADTVVTREDAERDLERRAALSQGQVKQAIGAAAWDKLDDRAKASLTSVAYNYGTLPASVAEAAKSGDKETIAKSIEGLSGHNAGINRRRRGLEAANVRGQDQAPKTQAEMIEEVMNDPSLKDRPEAQSAAVAQVNRSYALRHSQQIKEKAAFETRVKDTTAEAWNVGQPPTNPIPREDFIRQYGEVDGSNKYLDYTSDVQFSIDSKGMEIMSDTEMNSFIDQRSQSELVPGKPGYAHQLANIDRLRKRADQLQKERREDPTRAVSRDPAVIQAYAQYNPQNPETFRPVAEARLEAQKRLEIDAEIQSPISKAEALKLTVPLQRVLPGQEQQAVEQVGLTFRRMFGDYAPQALEYALRARRLNEAVLQQSSALMLNLSQGNPITEGERRDLYDRQQQASLDAAIRAAPNTSPPPWIFYGELGIPPTIGMPSMDGTKVEKPWPIPNTEAMRDLRDNPQTAPQFDKIFGPGAAKRVFDKVPGLSDKRQ